MVKLRSNVLRHASGGAGGGFSLFLTLDIGFLAV